MLDYNHRPGIAERVNAAIDAALIAEREVTPPRTYLGASRLGHACERALQFEFAGADPDDVAHFTNRTPYPTLHLLRSDSIARAVQAFPDASAIYDTNIATLRAMGRAGWDTLMKEWT